MNSVVTTAVLAVLVDAVLVLLRRVLTPWQPPSSRKAARRTSTIDGAARTPEGVS